MHIHLTYSEFADQIVSCGSVTVLTVTMNVGFLFKKLIPAWLIPTLVIPVASMHGYENGFLG